MTLLWSALAVLFVATPTFIGVLLWREPQRKRAR